MSNYQEVCKSCGDLIETNEIIKCDSCDKLVCIDCYSCGSCVCGIGVCMKCYHLNKGKCNYCSQ